MIKPFTMYPDHSDLDITFIMDSPNFMRYNSRLISYRKKWPQALKYLTEPLVEAGFYYTQKNDTVECFSCGLTLKNWNDDESPWEQHAIHAPRCDFINMVKGDSYIDFAREKHVIKV